jgi:hypothetical protein
LNYHYITQSKRNGYSYKTEDKPVDSENQKDFLSERLKAKTLTSYTSKGVENRNSHSLLVNAKHTASLEDSLAISYKAKGLVRSHACNPSYLGSRDGEDCAVQDQPRQKSSQDHHLNQ